MMSILFRFFVRLFAAMLATKLLLGFLGADTVGGLLGGALALVFLSYVFDLADWYTEGALRRALNPSEIGWRVARFLITLNQVGEAPPKEAGPAQQEGQKTH